MKIRDMEKGANRRAFFCPGCGCAHWFIAPGSWEWNGDYEKPTITPSILAWGDSFRCHSFVTDGKIRFLDDCSHELKGQTIELPDFSGSE